MAISMYDLSVPVFSRMLGNLSTVLDKAAAHAETSKIDPAALLQARLFPDMFPLIGQVQSACDAAKGCVARLAGEPPPKHEDNEITFADAQARIRKVLDYIQCVPREKIENSESRTITLPLRDRTLELPGLTFLLNFSTPNFYFHVTTAYALIRHSGVKIGKLDFLGKAG